MKFLGNIIWLIFGGLITSIEYLVSSLLLMITIIGIPFGLQTLKLALLALWPFGSTVTDNGNSGGCLCIIMNILWIILGGFWICLTHLGFGLLLCITIIGIPWGTFQNGCPCADSFRKEYQLIQYRITLPGFCPATSIKMPPFVWNDTESGLFHDPAQQLTVIICCTAYFTGIQ